MLIEQAIFASGRTDRTAGYQLLGRSPGISEADAQQLTAWGPSHDALLGTHTTAVSFNFFPLPSGAFCVSRTVLAGPEYSGRGRQVYTQCLVIGARDFGLFANNAFNAWRAAEAAGALIVYDQVPEHLAPLRLDAVGTAVDRHLLADLATQLGPAGIALVLESALVYPRIAISGHTDPIGIIAGLINCLPVACRPEFSFSTGLRAARQRPFRIMAAGDDAGQWQPLSTQYGLVVVNVDETACPDRQTPETGWAGFVAAALAGGRTSLLAAELSQPLPALGRAGLNDLGNRLRSKLCPDERRPPSDLWPAELAQRSEPPRINSLATPETAQRADAPHPRFQSNPSRGAAALAGVMQSRVATDQSAAVQELLEHLDDVVFAAINGRPDSLAELEVLWPTVMTALGPQLVEESREQYLRCALSIWTDYLGDSNQGTGARAAPERATAALDVVCLLFD